MGTAQRAVAGIPASWIFCSSGKHKAINPETDEKSRYIPVMISA